MTAFTKGCVQWLISNNFTIQQQLQILPSELTISSPVLCQSSQNSWSEHLGAGPRPKDKEQRAKTEWSSGLQKPYGHDKKLAKH